MKYMKTHIFFALLGFAPLVLATDSLAQENHYFGSDVEIISSGPHAGRIIVGAAGSNYADGSGAAYIMDIDGNNPQPLTPLPVGSSSGFGSSIASFPGSGGTHFLIRNSVINPFLFDANASGGAVVPSCQPYQVIDPLNDLIFGTTGSQTSVTNHRLCDSSGSMIGNPNVGGPVLPAGTGTGGRKKETHLLFNNMLFVVWTTSVRAFDVISTSPFVENTVTVASYNNHRDSDSDGSGATGLAAFTSDNVSLVVKGQSTAALEILTLPTPSSLSFSVSGTTFSGIAIHAASRRAAVVDTAGQVILYQLPTDFSNPAIAIGAFDPQDPAGDHTGSNPSYLPSVAINGTHVVVGVPQSDIDGSNAGHVYVFETP